MPCGKQHKKGKGKGNGKKRYIGGVPESTPAFQALVDHALSMSSRFAYTQVSAEYIIKKPENAPDSWFDDVQRQVERA